GLKATNGINEIDYLNTLPVITGVVDPPTVPTKDATLTPWGGGPPPCGNGTVDPGETCDGSPGPCSPGQVCTACACAAPPQCGDGVVDAGELCDDHNRVNGDGCDNNCTPTACGNGPPPTTGEDCDD